MQDLYKNNKQLLQNTIAATIKTLRFKQNKSISLISDEIGLAKSIWADLEKGIKDPQFSTLWKISEALGVPLSAVIIEIEKQMPVNFSLLDN